MNLSWPAFLVICILLVAVLLILLVPLPGSRTKKMRFVTRKPQTPLARDDERYWYGGILYNNPDDPELFVPKRSGLGWTINFGHPQGKWLLLGLLFFIVLLGVVFPLLFSSLAPQGCHPSHCNPF